MDIILPLFSLLFFLSLLSYRFHCTLCNLRNSHNALHHLLKAFCLYSTFSRQVILFNNICLYASSVFSFSDIWTEKNTIARLTYHLQNVFSPFRQCANTVAFLQNPSIPFICITQTFYDDICLFQATFSDPWGLISLSRPCLCVQTNISPVQRPGGLQHKYPTCAYFAHFKFSLDAPQRRQTRSFGDRSDVS